MYTSFSIHNFRNFDQDGIDVQLRPITILTGCNNSGKSSITKALCLMKGFCDQIDHDLEADNELRLEQYKLDFHKHPNDILGSFDLVRHRTKSRKADNSSEQKGNQRVVYEFIVSSHWLLQNVLIHLEFDSVEYDDLTDGYLKSFYIKTEGDKIICKAGLGEESYIDFRSVKQSFLYFLYGQHLFSRMQNYVSYKAAMGYEGFVDTDSEIKDYDDIYHEIYQKLGVNACAILTEWQMYHLNTKDDVKSSLNTSFAIISSELGVYCYFPCLYDFKDVAKSDVRQKINSMIASQDKPITSLEQKIIGLFLDSFEASDAQTLHEFINQEEDKRLFYITKGSFNKEKFTFPFVFIHLNALVNHIILDESDLPTEANWEVVIRAMDSINQMANHPQKSLIYHDEVDNCIVYEKEYTLSKYFRDVLKDVFSNIMPSKFYYSPTTLIQPKRLFSLENTDDFSNSLKHYFDAKKAFLKAEPQNILFSYYNYDNDYRPGSFVNKWMKILGIAHRVEIKPHADGYGATVRLYDKNDRKGLLLADKGLGGMHVFALLLKIETAILEQKVNERLHKPHNTGIDEKLVKLLTYSQLNPITLALEEPEVHLHPRYQSLLADMIVEAYQKYNIHFIIETHSEYLIRKLQVLVADKENKLTPNDVSLNYVDKDENGISTNRKIEIIEDGRLSEPFGPGFFDEATGLSMHLLKMKMESK